MNDWNGPMKWRPGGYAYYETLFDQLEYTSAYSFTETFEKDVASMTIIKMITPPVIPPQRSIFGFMMVFISY